MPVTAFGQYEVVVTTPVDGHDKVLSSKTFNYLPLYRIMLLGLVLAAGIACMFRPWRHWKHMTLQRWLMVIPAIPLVAMVILPWSFTMAMLGVIFAQLFGLSAVILYAGKSQSRRPITAVVMGYLANAIPAIVVAALCCFSYGTGSFAETVSYATGIGFLGALTWYAPTLLSLVAVRRTFTSLRMLSGLGIAWGIVLVTVTGIAACLTEISALVLPIVFGVMMFSGFFPIGFLILILTNTGCREAVIRTYGLDKDRPIPPPLP